MAEKAKETREAKAPETREETHEEKSMVDMTPEEYSRRFNPVAAHLTKSAKPADES